MRSAQTRDARSLSPNVLEPPRTAKGATTRLSWSVSQPTQQARATRALIFEADMETKNGTSKTPCLNVTTTEHTFRKSTPTSYQFNEEKGTSTWIST